MTEANDLEARVDAMLDAFDAEDAALVAEHGPEKASAIVQRGIAILRGELLNDE